MSRLDNSLEMFRKSFMRICTTQPEAISGFWMAKNRDFPLMTAT